MNVVLSTVVIAANILGSGMALPQVRRLARTRRADGVSSIWVGVSVAINGWWIAYAVAAPVWAILPISTVSFVLYAWMAVILVRSVGRTSVNGLLIGLLGLGMIPLPFLVTSGWVVAGTVIGFCYGVQLLPAVIAVMRSRALGGVSPTTWLIAWLEGGLWLVYGIGLADTAITTAGLVGMVMSSAILVRLAVTGHRPLQPLVARLQFAA